MSKQDYYDLLKVGRDADEAELKRAYRKQAMQYHPDRNPGDQEAEAKFKEISEAYEVLSDPEKRAAYNQYGHAAFESGGPGAGFDFNFSSSFADVFDDLFGEFMGGGRRGGRGGATRGSDLRYNLSVSLEDAYAGLKTEIEVPTSVSCDDCGGSGAAKGSKPATCGTCQGHGKVRAQSGFFTIERTCPTCQGAGQVIDDPCRGCGGVGRTTKEKTLSVNIPAGVEDGTRIRLSGEGEVGLRGGPTGDLYIFIAIEPHNIFQRDGGNIYCRVPISMVAATLGGSVQVPTLGGGRANITLPAGTQNGKQFRLRGKGMPHLRGHGQGDLYIQVQVETPVNLTKRQKELLREFDQAGDDQQSSPQSAGFFDKVKELWNDVTD